MTDDSLRDVVPEYGASKLAEAIEQEFRGSLNRAMLMGEPLGDLRDVNTAFRKYDHGQASQNTVVEHGIKASFDPQQVDLDDLQPGGTVRARLKSLANQYLDVPVKKLDLHRVTDGEYVIWIIADRDT